MLLRGEKIFQRVDGFTFDLQRFDSDTWDGTTSSVPTATNNVITITTAEQLAAFATVVNNGNNYSGVTIKLGADLDLSGHNWTPIGTSSNPFKGTFDGDGHTINKLTISGSSENVGLFGYVGEGGTITGNIVVSEITAGDKSYVGNIIAY